MHGVPLNPRAAGCRPGPGTSQARLPHTPPAHRCAQSPSLVTNTRPTDCTSRRPTVNSRGGSTPCTGWEGRRWGRRRPRRPRLRDAGAHPRPNMPPAPERVPWVHARATPGARDPAGTGPDGLPRLPHPLPPAGWAGCCTGSPWVCSPQSKTDARGWPQKGSSPAPSPAHRFVDEVRVCVSMCVCVWRAAGPSYGAHPERGMGRGGPTRHTSPPGSTRSSPVQHG